MNRLDWTLLCWVVTENHHVSIEVLLSFSFTIVNRIDSKTNNSIHVTCITHLSSIIIKIILNNLRTNVNAKSFENWTALHLLLTKSKHLEIIYSLLNKDDLNIFATNQNEVILLKECFYDDVIKNIVLKILNKFDISTKWFLKRLRRNSIDRFSLLRSIKFNSYLSQVNKWKWSCVENLILFRDSSQMMKLKNDMSFIEKYAFRDVRQRLIQILNLLSHNIFRRNILH